MSQREPAETALGVAVVARERARWSFTNDTEILTLANGLRVIRQAGWGGDLQRRVAVAGEVRRRAAGAGLLLPDVLAVEGDEAAPLVIMTLLSGVPAAELLAPTAEGRAAAAAMGAALARLRAVRVDGLELDRSWAAPDQVATASRARLRSVGRDLGDAGRTALAVAIEHLESQPTGGPHPPGVLAHGDYAPVNILFESGAVTGIVDLETLCVADPRLDVAWWGWVVWFHHRNLWPILWPPFLEGSGWPADDEAASWPALRELVLLRLLEQLAKAPSDQVREQWSSRIEATLAWDPDSNRLHASRAAS